MNCLLRRRRVMAVEAVSSAGDEPLPTCSPDLALSHLDNKNKHTARLYCRYSRLKHTARHYCRYSRLIHTARHYCRYSRLKHTARHYGRYSRLKGHTIIRAILLAHSSIVEDISLCLSVTQWISTACTLSYLQKNSRTLQDQTHFPRISRSWKIHKKLVPYGDWRSTSARAY